MRLLLIVFLCFLAHNNFYAQKAKSNEQLKSIDSITLNMKVDKGLITTYQNKINLLMNEKDLNPTVKGLLMQLKNDFYTLSKRKTRFASGKKKAHFNYLKSLSNN